MFGRKRGRILARGHTVWPAVVEEALQSHPYVEMAAAFGVPDPLRCSTDVMAIVKLREDHQPTQGLEDELLELCRGRLKEYELPSRITFVDNIPVTTMGKVDRGALLRMIDEKIKEHVEGSGEEP